MGLGPARVGLGGAARESVFRSSVRAVSRIEASRTETHAKPREIQPRESENSERSTRGKDGRQKSALRRQKYCSAPEARLNARAGASLSIALLLPCPLLPVPGGNLSKLDAGTSLSVSGASRCHFQLPRRPEVRIWRKIRSERDVLFGARATGKSCATRLPARDSSTQLYYNS